MPPFDIDALARQRPSWRLHRAHPALGLLAAEEAGEIPGGDREARDFGLKWLRLPEQEQRLRERDFFAGLLRHAAHAGDARFHLSDAPGVTRDALRTLPEVSQDEDGDCSGPLTDEVIDVLACRSWDWLEVACAGRPFLLEAGEHDGTARTDVLLWLDPWSAGDLRAELEEVWWPAAAARAAERGVAGGDVVTRGNGEVATRAGGRIDRETRAAVLYAWDRYGARAVTLVGVFALTRVLADTWQSAMVILVALFAVVATVDGVLTRWHRRG